MDLLERATVMHFHRHRIALHGIDSVESMGWREPASQRGRFETIAAAIDADHSTVLDVGCGTGDLKRFLDERFSGVSYLGIDQQPEFIAAARARHQGDASAVFIEGNADRLPLPRADHVIACGLLGYRSANPRHLFQTIARLFAAAHQTLVFNVLDQRRFPADHPLLVGRDVAAVDAFCRQLCGDVTLVEGYAVDDATFVLRL
jgi:SAM-dependent methyltransferase